jgi:SAM-dependent MidA family methyltransferase
VLVLATLPLLQILARGPLSIAEFMRQALLHPTHGYYTREGAEVFGRGGDFVTSPDITQVFGEIIGVWLVAMWEALGSPPHVRLVELGPGRGTLMKDVLRTAKHFPSFSMALSVELVEASAVMRKRQADALECVPLGDDVGVAGSGAAFESMASGGGNGPVVSWYPHFSLVPKDGIALIVAHELFDALPVHQIEKTSRGWRERLVTVDDDDGPHPFGLALARGETPASRYFTTIHPTSAPSDVPDSDPSLAVWKQRPAPPPSKFEGLEDTMGGAPDDGAPSSSPREFASPASQFVAQEAQAFRERAKSRLSPRLRAALQRGADGVGALNRAMAADERDQQDPEAAAVSRAESDRLQMLDMLRERHGVADPSPTPLEERAMRAAASSRALDTAARSGSMMGRLGTEARELQTKSDSTGRGEDTGDSSTTELFQSLRPIHATAQPVEDSPRSESLAQVADAAVKAHRKLSEQEGVLEKLAAAASNGTTIGDLEKEAAELWGSLQRQQRRESATDKPPKGWLDLAPVGTAIEFSPASSVLAYELAERVGRQGGAALVIDYGNDGASAGSIRGIRDHEFVSFLQEVGDTDITADVDFRGLRHAVQCSHEGATTVGPVGQGEFLQRMGIRERTIAALEAMDTDDEALTAMDTTHAEEAMPLWKEEGDARQIDGSDLSRSERLIAAVERLVNPETGMGSIFKAMAIVPKPLVGPDGPGVPGFPADERQ